MTPVAVTLMVVSYKVNSGRMHWWVQYCEHICTVLTALIVLFPAVRCFLSIRRITVLYLNLSFWSLKLGIRILCFRQNSLNASILFFPFFLNYIYRMFLDRSCLCAMLLAVGTVVMANEKTCDLVGEIGHESTKELAVLEHLKPLFGQRYNVFMDKVKHE